LVKHGIDVSKFQGLIDWQEVKKHIDFAIIRCGYGSNLESQDDPYFKRNADECTRLKIPFGVYLYSYAKNVEDAKLEANELIKYLNLMYSTKQLYKKESFKRKIQMAFVKKS